MGDFAVGAFFGFGVGAVLAIVVALVGQYRYGRLARNAAVNSNRIAVFFYRSGRSDMAAGREMWAGLTAEEAVHQLSLGLGPSIDDVDEQPPRGTTSSAPGFH